MKFTTPCFVRVENPQERKELIEWLEGIGYECVYGGSVDDNLISCYGDSFGVDYKSHMGCYNCDTNIPLFKALAAMNGGNDREQLFVNPMGSMYVVCYDTIYNELGLIPDKWRKATVKEIINHFKQ